MKVRGESKPYTDGGGLPASTSRIGLEETRASGGWGVLAEVDRPRFMPIGTATQQSRIRLVIRGGRWTRGDDSRNLPIAGLPLGGGSGNIPQVSLQSFAGRNRIDSRPSTMDDCQTVDEKSTSAPQEETAGALKWTALAGARGLWGEARAPRPSWKPARLTSVETGRLDPSPWWGQWQTSAAQCRHRLFRIFCERQGPVIG